MVSAQVVFRISGSGIFRDVGGKDGEVGELTGGSKVPINPGYVLHHDNEKIVIRNYEGKIFEYPDSGNENVQFAPQREYHDENLYSYDRGATRSKAVALQRLKSFFLGCSHSLRIAVWQPSKP